MIAIRTRWVASLAVLAALALLPSEQGASAGAASVDPAALQLLEGMTDHLGSLRRFSVDTQNIVEEVLESGYKVQHDFTTHLVVQRPDKLRAEQRGDRVDRVLVYDGKTLAINDRRAGYYAVADAPDDIDAALHFARDELDIVPPSGDLMFTNSFELLTNAITSATAVGKSVIGGLSCDHLAFRSPLVDWQIWIADDGEPLPLKYVLTTRGDPTHPQYILFLSNWNAAPRTDASSFDFSPPANARKVDFLSMGDDRPSGR